MVITIKIRLVSTTDVLYINIHSTILNFGLFANPNQDACILHPDVLSNFFFD